MRVLRQDIGHINLYKYNTKFTIATDLTHIIRSSIAECDYNPRNVTPSTVKLFIDDCKNHGWLPHQVENPEASYQKEKLIRVYEKYQQHLARMNCLDFGDLLTLTLDIFVNHPDVLERWADRFPYIQVDEYQDTNQVQYQLMKLLSLKYRNLCVVGDIQQSIYSWRGACINNIIDFKSHYPDAKVIKLEQNYRCGQKILQAANSIIANNNNSVTMNLFTNKKSCHEIIVATLDDATQEGQYVADMIVKGQQEYGYKYSDYAVLYRVNALSRGVEEALVKQGVPYKIIGSYGYYDRKEVKDILAYLNVLNNNSDTLSLRRIINVPARGLGDSTVSTLTAKAEEKGTSLHTIITNKNNIAELNGRTFDMVSTFSRILTDLQSMIDRKSLPKLIEAVINDTGYKRDLEGDGEAAQGRLDNAMELVAVAHEFCKKTKDKSLDAFLKRIALVSSINHDQKENDNRVTLLTMHAAKGMEFGICFIVGAEEKLFPHWRSFDSEEAIEEERRLCYVAITRSKERLYITNVRNRYLQGQVQNLELSRFISEIPEECILEEYFYDDE